MSDLISRKALLNSMGKRYGEKVNIVPDNLAEGFVQMEKLIKEQPTVLNLESVFAELEEKLNQLREAQSADCKKHDGYWTPEQGVRGGGIKAYLEILEILESAANATNGKIGG